MTNSDSSMVAIPRKPLSVIEALALLRQGRPIAEPNEGFMDQLYLWADMNCPTSQTELESHKLYRRWMNKRNVEESLRINRAPDMVDILFEDEAEPVPSLETITKQASRLDLANEEQQSIDSGISAPTGSFESPTSPPQTVIKCRRCRHTLATTPFLIAHEPSRSDPSSTTSDTACAHVFLHPLSWMRKALAEGQLEGRLTCPNKKCGQNVGKFAWQGLRCSCGKWITPGFGVARGKIDVVVTRAKGQLHGQDLVAETGLESAGGGAVRLPPGMRKQGKI
jgi:dual specificity phosphatase 12